MVQSSNYVNHAIRVFRLFAPSSSFLNDWTPLEWRESAPRSCHQIFIPAATPTQPQSLRVGRESPRTGATPRTGLSLREGEVIDAWTTVNFQQIRGILACCIMLLVHDLHDLHVITSRSQASRLSTAICLNICTWESGIPSGAHCNPASFSLPMQATMQRACR